VISAEPLDASTEEYVIPPEEFPAYEDDIYNFESTHDAEDEAPREEGGDDAPRPAKTSQPS